MAITINGSGTLTGITAGGLPDAIITQPELAANVAGNGPAFSAYQSSAQAISAGTFTKLQVQTEEFDTNNNFDSTTNYRFTPTVAGYYSVTGQAQLVNSVSTEFALSVYKNSGSSKYLGDVITGQNRSVGGAALIYLNGSTDYIELYVYSSVAGTLTASAVTTFFQAAMIRAA
jgi:hypothetical protein